MVWFEDDFWQVVVEVFFEEVDDFFCIGFQVVGFGDVVGWEVVVYVDYFQDDVVFFFQVFEDYFDFGDCCVLY